MSHGNTHVLLRRYLDADFEVVDTDWGGAPERESTEQLPRELADALAEIERTDVFEESGESIVEAEIDWSGRSLRVFAERYTTGQNGFEGVVETVVRRSDDRAPAEP